MKQKVLFVTGATEGVAASLADKAMAAGHLVVATARDPRPLIERYDSSPGALVIALDVADEIQAHAAAMAAMKRFGRIDVLIANVLGLAGVTRAVLPYLRLRGAGHLIFFGDGRADREVSESSNALAAELAPLGIRVTFVETGYLPDEAPRARDEIIADRLIELIGG